jgi:hypothetical protein
MIYFEFRRKYINFATVKSLNIIIKPKTKNEES